MANSYSTGDKVGYKGNLWEVVFQSGNLIKITRSGVQKTVKITQVELVKAA